MRTKISKNTPGKHYKAVTSKGNYPYSFFLYKWLWEDQKSFNK